LSSSQSIIILIDWFLLLRLFINMEQTRVRANDLPVHSNPDPNLGTVWKPKAVIFDLLTALLDSWSLWKSAAGSPENGHKWRVRYLELTFGCGAYKSYEDLVHQSASDVGLGSEAPAKLLEDWDQLEPWPEVGNVLTKLRAEGFKLGVVTNCSTELGRRAAKLVGAWDGIVTAEEVG
jgi:2-haloacid dehalogenase